MLEGTTCAACGEEFDYPAPQHLLHDDKAYEISVRYGLDAPLLCENCEIDDDWEDYQL